MRRFISFLAFGWLILLCACHPLDNPSGKEEEQEPERVAIKEFKTSVDTLFIKVGEVKTVKGIITPEELSSEVHVHWKSYNESVITVDEGGNVTALEYGAALLEAEIHNELYGYFYRSIPVYVTFSDEPVPNPEEMYQHWLGSWELSGPVYQPVHASVPGYSPQLQYWARYLISITELVPMETYRLVGWKQFLGPSTGPSPFPGIPLILTARFDRKTGNLVFFRNCAHNLKDFYMSPYWADATYTYDGLYQRSYLDGLDANYPCADDVDIAYAIPNNEKEAVVRGVYNQLDETCYYHIGMGFATDEGGWLDKPMYFPLLLYRQKDTPVEEITLSEPSLDLIVGDEKTLSAMWSPFHAAGFKGKWTSSNPDVVSVSYSDTDPLIECQLTAHFAGRAEVTVSLGAASATCEVVVRKPYIVFFTYEVRDILCALWDTDGDGELSFEEAAAVTSFGLPFHAEGDESYWGIYVWYFNELQYFTSLKELSAHCFQMTYLHEVTIPANIEKIGTFAFADNPLQDVTFLGPPPQIEKDAFEALYDSFNMWVPDEYYDAYMDEANKKDSAWEKYASNIHRVSERKSIPTYGGVDYVPEQGKRNPGSSPG